MRSKAVSSSPGELSHSRERIRPGTRDARNAYKKYDDDPDILIAMYRVPDATAEYKQQTRDRIAKMSESYTGSIDDSPKIRRCTINGPGW